MTMHLKKRVRPVLLAACLLFSLFSLASCGYREKIDRNDKVSAEFLDLALQDDYASAYALVSATISDGDFAAYWGSIRETLEGAESYRQERNDWSVDTVNGQTSVTTAYRVILDNGKTAWLRVVTREDISGIAGIHFSDVTEFLDSTRAYMPTVQVILGVFSGVVFLFMLLMLVDCLRRKMRYKVLWVILILCGIGVTVAFGENFATEYFAGLMIETSSITPDPGTLTVSVRLMIPVGAVLYLWLRNRFVVEPASDEPADSIEPDEEGAPPTA